MTSLISAVGALPFWNASVALLLIKATVILVSALGITIAMHRTSATARHLVWLVTLGGLLLVPALTAWSPLKLAILPATSWDVHDSRAGQPAAGPANDARNETIMTAPDGASIAANSARQQIPTPTTGGGASTLPTLALGGLSLAVTIWGAVVLGILISLAWAGMSVRRIVRHARPLDSPDWVTPLFEIADRIGLDDAPRLLQSTEAKMPFACGIAKPTIVLPAESEGWTLDRRRAVLLHELAHVRRHDLLGHTLGRVVCAVYWFHPLVWTAAKRLRSESERACDDLALACGTRATDYAEHLLDIVTSVRGDSTPLVALAMARRKEFEGRMLAILDPDLRHSTPSRRQSVALIAALALISLTVGAVAPVARSAEAAIVAPPTQPQAAPKPVAEPSLASPTLADAPLRTQAPTAPESEVPGVMSKHTAFSKSIPTSTTLSQSNWQSMSQSTSSAVPDGRPGITLDASVNALASAGAQIGMSAGLKAASSALAALGIDAKGLKGAMDGRRNKDGDDRPILLARVLKADTSASLRRIAAWGLQEYADSPVASDALTNALRHDADWRVREMAAWALGESNRQPTATDALVAALKSDSEERVRATAAWALGEHDAQSALDALAAALSDPSADIRQRAAWAIGNISPKQAPKALVATLKDKDPHTRTVVAWALYNIEDESAAPALEAALKAEQDSNVQLAMIRSLAVLGERSVDALKGLLESNDPRVKNMAVRALAGGHAAGPWPWPWPMPRPFP